MKAGKIVKGLSSWCFLALLLSQFLAACGGSATPNPNAPVDLTLWTYPAVPEASAPPADWDLYKAVRQKLNINLKVSLIPLGDDGNAKMSAAAAANNLPDLFQITNPSLFFQWVNLGLIAPVDNLLPLMPQRTKARYSDPTLRKLGTVNNKLYGLLEPTPLAKRQGLFIRKDWLDKLGLQVPKTLDDFLNVAKAFTTRDPDGDGKNDTYGFGTFIDPITPPGLGTNFNFIYGAYGLAGPWNLNTPGKVSLSFRDPGYLQGTEFLKKLVDAKVVDPDWSTMGTNDFRARWKQGKYGMFIEDYCALGCQANYQAFDQNFPNGMYVPINPPVGPDGQSALGSYNNVGLRLGISQKALSSGKGPAIARLLEWLNSGEGYYLAGFGKAGTNYKLDAQGNISITGVPVPFTARSEAPYIQIRNLVLSGSPAELNVRYPSFKTKSGRTQVPMQLYQQIAGMPWEDVTPTFAITPASNQADLNRYISESLVQFITGQKPLNSASWAAFVKGLDGLNAGDWENTANQTLQAKGLLK